MRGGRKKEESVGDNGENDRGERVRESAPRRQRKQAQISGLRTLSKVRASGLGGPQPHLGSEALLPHTHTQTHMSSLHRVGRWLLWASACPGFILQ